MTNQDDNHGLIIQQNDASYSLINHPWPQFLRGPDRDLLEKLYIPALSEAVRYDRCCAYFSSSVLSAAAQGFGNLIKHLIEYGENAPKPAVRFIVNEQLSREDVDALLQKGDCSALERLLINRLGNPTTLLEKQRLEMLGWLVQKGYLIVRVGIMRSGYGIVHAKYGLIYDPSGNAIVFSGSGNETAQGLIANYDHLEISESWTDPIRFQHYREEFENIWNDTDDFVRTMPLPEAVEKELIKFAGPEPPIREPRETEPVSSGIKGETDRKKTAMLWKFLAHSAYLPDSAASCYLTAPLDHLWPHQQNVIEEVTAAWPEGRLLCDEVGMGKTIEAIMAIRSLLGGRGVRRVLFLLPAGLTLQWQEELREKGGLVVPRLKNANTLVWPDGSVEQLDSLYDALDQNLLIMSRELARLPDNRRILFTSDPWDLVLMDEAHAARRGKQEEGEFNSSTLLLNLLRELQARGKVRSFLFLSATPMQTSPWEPWDLLGVLGEGDGWMADFDGIRSYYNVIHDLTIGNKPTEDEAKKAAWLIHSDPSFPDPPQVFKKIQSPDEGQRRIRFLPPSAKPKVIEWMRKGSPLHRRMHRNTRATLKKYYEMHLIPIPPPKREVIDISYDYQPVNGLERQAYNAITHYIDRRFEELESEKPGKGFVMTIYRRRAASSPYALRCSLLRRRDGLDKVIKKRAQSGLIDLVDVPMSEYWDSLPDDIDPQEISASFPTDPQEAMREKEEVEVLLKKLDDLGSTDTKLEYFFNIIRTVVNESRPVLVFTEYTDTMEYLRDHLADHFGRDVGSYCGDGGAIYVDGVWQNVTKKGITDRLRERKILFLICTDAASEGLNLQAASALVNYDLPWVPSRVEQRIGRIDRIGQEETEVKIFNLFLLDSIDEKVYKALDSRCDLFRHFVGTMQPVLARAKMMLNDPKTFSIEEIDRWVDLMKKDALSAETYIEAEAVKPSIPSIKPVTKKDLIDALNLLQNEVIRESNGDNVYSIRLPESSTPLRISLSANSLDGDPSLFPFTILDPSVKMISDYLNRTEVRLPLVIGTYCDKGFQSSFAVWIHRNHLQEVKSIDDLKNLLSIWEGEQADAEKIVGALRHASSMAKQKVESNKLRYLKSLNKEYNQQQNAVKIRTARELGRLIKSLKPNLVLTDLQIDSQFITEGALTPKIIDAIQRLGVQFRLTEYLKWEITQFIASLNRNETRSRLSGSSLDAALNDYRWKIQDNTVDVLK